MAALFTELMGYSAISDNPERAEAGRKLMAAQKFIFDLATIPQEILNGGWRFAGQLLEHGLLQLPFPICAFICGPFPKWKSLKRHVILAWVYGETIAAKCYRIEPDRGECIVGAH
jgi:hypothetical protein